MAKRLVSIVAAALVVFSGALPTAMGRSKVNPAEIQELNRQIEQQEQTLQQLKARVQALEDPKAAKQPEAVKEPKVGTQEVKPSPPAEEAPQSDVLSIKGEPPSPIEEAEAKMNKSLGRQSPVPYQRNFDDRQDAAPRPGDFTLDPKYRGFIPIPHTAFMVKFNPKPRVDMMVDSGNTGDDFRFVTAKIPLEGSPEHGGGGRFNANGNGSQLRVDMRAPSLPGNLRFYYQNDFFGSQTANFNYRLQHLYGQFYGVTAGFTYGFFEDPDVWPNTVDYEGPNSMIFARRPLAHYTWMISDSMNMTFGLEDPDFFVDNAGDPLAIPNQRMPDVGFNFRWEPDGIGHMQFSTIFRSVGVNGDLFANDADFGWGINLSGAFDIGKRDTVQFLGVGGYGIGGLGNDSGFENTDAAFNADGDLKALPYFSAMLGYTHRWTPRLSSTLSYGYVNVGNEDLQAGDAYNFTHYGSWNLVWNIFKRLNVGAEGLYGFREVKDGRNGDVFRAQLSLVYSVFD
ncbi:MAG TPA: DcaP family trimeric outer membrane transporter [bacterium]|nr:DcaP family trimeric outer membrane transporter [bacterium]